MKIDFINLVRINFGINHQPPTRPPPLPNESHIKIRLNEKEK